MNTKLLRQKILDLAIHGKLVPQDPNDEPASVLLERIKAEKERLIKEGKIKKSKSSSKTSDTHHYENVPFEVPEGWVWTTLGEIFTLQAGKNITSQHISTTKDDIYQFPCYGGNGLRGFVDRYNKEGRYPLIGRQGALCGNINEANGRFYATEHAVIVDTFCDTDIDWTIQALNYLNLNQYATSTAQPGLAVSTINDVLIPLPPITEQKRIARETECWFALIDIIESSKDDLQSTIKQTKSKILDLAIHGKLVPQDPNDEPAIELLKRINPKAEITCDNAHYEQLPKGWELTQMGNLCKLIDGEKQGGCEMVNLDVKYLRGEKEGKLFDAGRKVNADTILILVDGENSGEVFRTPKEGYQGSTFKVLSINSNMNEEYILHVIRMKQKVLRESKVGSAIPHLNKKLFKEMFVPIPSYKEQSRIVEGIDKVMTLLDRVAEKL